MSSKKKEMSSFQMVLRVTLISAISAFLLSFVNGMTKDRVLESQKMEKVQAIKKMFPSFNNDPFAEKVHLKFGKKDVYVYPVKKDGKVIGHVVETYSTKGYGGNILILVGISTDGLIVNNGVYILEKRETPGLGDKIGEPWFLKQFFHHGLSSKDFRFGVKKDGEGDVEAITSATISSRAITGAIKEALIIDQKFAKGDLKPIREGAK